MGRRSTHNQLLPSVGSALVVVAFAAVVLVFVLGVLDATKKDTLQCGSSSTTVQAHQGDTTQSLVAEAISKMGYSVDQITNFTDAYQQGNINPDVAEYLNVCLTPDNKKVGRVGDVNIRG